MSALIYKITSPDNSKVYIGSTTQDIPRRKAHHKYDYKVWKDGFKRICQSYLMFDEYGFDNCKYDVIEETSKDNRFIRERFWIENTKDVINVNRPIATEEEKKETKRIYSMTEKAKEDRYNYRMKNKDYINAVKSEVIKCECGGTYTRSHKNRHLQSLKHIEFINK
jgi:hypothetical protein